MSCRPHRRGYALLLALFVLFVLSALAVSVQSSLRWSTGRYQDRVYNLRARWAARGGVHMALERLRGMPDGYGIDHVDVEWQAPRARAEGWVQPAEPHLLAALPPGTATDAVVVVCGCGEALVGEAARAQETCGLLVRRRSGAELEPLLWVPGRLLTERK